MSDAHIKFNGYNINRKERLRSKEDIKRIFETGYRARSGKALARYIIGKGRDVPLRFGVAAGKGVGGAVIRNRCKRILREAVRREKAVFNNRLADLHCSADVMFIWADEPKNGNRETSFQKRLLPEILPSVNALLNTVMEKAGVK
jgi:ribonuclease P protein component